MADIPTWFRVHRLDAPVTLWAVTSPVDGRWILRADGWTLPPHAQCVHADLCTAQLTADDVLVNFNPHDCRTAGCGDWTPLRGTTVAATNSSERRLAYPFN